MVEITPELIVDLYFDARNLNKLYLSEGGAIIDSAGAIRRRFIEEGLEKIPRSVILTVVDLPEYNARIYSELLNNA